MANGVTSYDTVKQYLSAIKKLHELGGFEFPKEVHRLKQQLNAIRRELAGPVKKAVPITPEILSKIYGVVDLQKPIEVVSYFGLLLGFCLFLRKSNLVPETPEAFNGKEQLTRGDVSFRGVLTLVDIKWSKTLQYRNRELTLPLLAARNKSVCPVYWMRYIFTQYPARVNDPLLSYPKNGVMVPITYEQLGGHLTEWVKKVGYPSDEGFTLHGLHRGGANHTLTVGLAGEDIQLMGDWASNAYMSYIDLNLDRRVSNMVSVT